MSTLLLLIGLGFTQVTVQGTSLCLTCSITVSQWTEQLSALPSGYTHSLFVIPDFSITRTLEAEAINQIAFRLQKTQLGKDLVKRSIQNNIKYRLFYQITRDENGRQHPVIDLPRYILEEKKPHELYGFFIAQEEKAILFLNEYQSQYMGQYTIVHDLTHLLDVTTMKYLEKWQGQWTELDDFALEVRAQFVETLFHQQRKRINDSEIIPDNDETRSYDRLNHPSKITAFVLNALYPLSSAPPISLQEEQTPEILIYSQNNFREKQAVSAISENPFANLGLAFEKALGQQNQLFTHFIGVLKYEPVTPKVTTNNQFRREKLNALAQQRGSKNLTEYLENQGLFETAVELRASGVNNYLEHFGPKPRDGGGK